MGRRAFSTTSSPSSTCTRASKLIPSPPKASTEVKQVKHKITAVRQKAKQVVELLVNQEYLDEERAKAQNIKEKMGLSNTYSNARYEGPSSKSTSYSGSSGSSYQGMGSDQQYDAKKGRDYDDKPK